MSLLEDVIDVGSVRYELDWSNIGESVLQRLQPTPSFPVDVLDVHNFPTYWCVPLLVGDYVGSTRAPVVADLQLFVAACLVRHFMFEEREMFALSTDDDLVTMVAAAYHACMLDAAKPTFEARFNAKCQPWSMLLALGTRSILASTSSLADYEAALRAIVLVYSCLQVIDDWHDRADDLARGHWNMWSDEPPRSSLAIIEPLVAGARQAVEGLRPHLLRRALTAQLADTVLELAEVVDLHRPDEPRLHRAGPSHRESFDDPKLGHRLDSAVAAGVSFLRRQLTSEWQPTWRDFELPGVTAGSTDCVSAFVAYQLARVPEAAGIARSVGEHLLAQSRNTVGWGYRQDVPADCDSTAWALLAAVATGVRIPTHTLSVSQDFIAGHRRRNGGFATYRSEARGLLTQANRRAWFEPELSVTCSAVLALGATGFGQRERLQEACAFVARSSDEGLWTSYWWGGSAYATFLAACALRLNGDGAYDDLLAKTHRRVLRLRRSDGGWSEQGECAEGFATSLALRTLMLGAPSMDIDSLTESVALLLGMQLESGAWPATALMLAPGADSGGDLVLRDNGVATTACVLSAIGAIRDTSARRLDYFPLSIADGVPDSVATPRSHLG